VNVISTAGTPDTTCTNHGYLIQVNGVDSGEACNGVAGSQGATGAAGPQGVPGPAGPAGLTTGVSNGEVFKQFTDFDTSDTVDTLALTPGNYFVSATVSINPPSPSVGQAVLTGEWVSCSLTNASTGGGVDSGQLSLTQWNNGTPGNFVAAAAAGTISLSGLVNGASSVKVVCTAFEGDQKPAANGYLTNVTAVQVANTST